jgi:hypothetical protein
MKLMKCHQIAKTQSGYVMHCDSKNVIQSLVYVLTSLLITGDPDKLGTLMY